MVDVGVAITWIVISAVSVIGLSAYARAAAISGANAELASYAFAFHDMHGPEDVYAIGAHPRLPAVSVGGLTNAAAGDVDAASF